jgi:hypothetical protein
MSILLPLLLLLLPLLLLLLLQDSWECARRAKAVGYPLFGLTQGEVFPTFGVQCW